MCLMKRLIQYSTVLACLAFLLSCSDTFLDPFENDGRYYSVYGFLDVSESVHHVRVVEITRFAEEIEENRSDTRNLDARVTSTDLSTGESTLWTHQLRQLEDGTWGHVFSGRFLVRPGRTYRLEIERSDGKVTSAETTVPRFPTTIPSPDTLFFPYEANPDSAHSAVVTVPDIASPWDITLFYNLQSRNVAVPYGRAGTRTRAGGWQFEVDMPRDAPQMRADLGLEPSDPLPLLHAITLQIRALDANWDPPDGIFDPDILAQPGTMSNVRNGYGFFGSVGLYQHTWIPAPRQVVGLQVP